LDEFKSTIERDNLGYAVLSVENDDDKNQQFIEYLKDHVLDSFCIVFVRTTKKAEKISEFINQEL
jgi:superfamily II DNA helicase RecQ